MFIYNGIKFYDIYQQTSDAKYGYLKNPKKNGCNVSVSI